MCRFLNICRCLLFVVALIRPALAQESTLTNYEVFGVPDEVIKVIEAPKFEEKIIQVAFPDCNDERVLHQARHYLTHENQDKNSSIVDYRKQKLTLKYMENFTDVNMATFKPSHNYFLAEELFNLKSQKGINSGGLKVCVSINKFSNQKVYMIMYKDDPYIKFILFSGNYKTEFAILDQNLQK